MERQGNVKLMIVGLLISAIVVSGGFYYMQTQAEEVKEVGEVAEVQQEIAYVNSEYNFGLTIPTSWTGYETEGRILNWGDLGTCDSVDFGFTNEGQFNSFLNVSIHTQDQWEALQSAGGPVPTYLGEDDDYTFGYSSAQDDGSGLYVGQLTEIQSIANSFKITEFNFIFSYGNSGVAVRNELNTFNDTFIKDMIVAEPITTEIELSDDEMLMIKNEIAGLDLTGEKSSDTWMTPCSEYSLTTNEQITWDDCNGMTEDQTKFVDFMRQFIDSQKEIQDLPEPQGGYL